ncbi:MAG: hypothetical protein KJ905_03890 [Nanoarchaeota archaeon]|nr:hypothetical protein [Nanoarchaeota archaeon]MBU1501882.1 hypothetical protein [Nanoarchaeota archaeon]MBU2458981.1 hypothetical protein [Nanoarchaeota archaeon]
MEDILFSILDAMASKEAEGVKFVNLCNPSDEKKIGEAFVINPENPLILVGFDDKERLKDNLKLTTILARPRCAYVKLPCKLEDLHEAVKEVKAESRKQMAVALEKATELEETKKQVWYIKHLNCYREGDAEQIRKLAEERLNWVGTGEEIMKRLAEFRPEREIAKHFSGTAIPGVFCDVEGTLLDWNGNLNQEVVVMLEKHEAEGKAVSLWSGGDPKEILPKIKGIKWPFLSKYDFEGCTMEIVIDDVPAAKLKKDYEIQAKQYVHWNPYGIWN